MNLPCGTTTWNDDEANDREITPEWPYPAPVAVLVAVANLDGRAAQTRYIIIGGRGVTRDRIRQPQSEPGEWDSAIVLAQLDRILSTPLFQHSKRYPAFLRHVVEQTLRGAGD